MGRLASHGPLVATVALLALTGCAYALGPHMLIDGAEFSVEAMDQLTPGAEPEEVQAILGDPWRRKESGDRQRWEYYSRYQHRSCRVLLLGFLPVKSRPKQAYRAELVFGPGGLERATLRIKDWGERQTIDLLRKRSGGETASPGP